MEGCRTQFRVIAVGGTVQILVPVALAVWLGMQQRAADPAAELAARVAVGVCVAAWAAFMIIVATGGLKVDDSTEAYCGEEDEGEK
jgi:hypothetical protein